MTHRTIQEQIVKYLGDVHAIEEQALPQVKAAPKIAGDPVLANAFERHIGETEDQKERIEERLEELGSSPNKIKDLAGALSGPAFVLFARAQPDTPGKLASHAYSYEHMELAAYELLSRIARRGQDDDTAALAKSIAGQERDMANRLEDWDRVVEASLDAVGRDDLDERLNKYLSDAHAIESQALQMLAVAPKIAGDEQLKQAYEHHHTETKGQQERIEARLTARDANKNLLKDVAMRLGAINWGTFFAVQPDTPLKLAAFAYAFEHLEIAAYEHLKRVAERAGDQETARTVETILAEERSAAETLWNGFDRALDASLDKLGVLA
jgi:ferritin-like metal-binding protein YciE